MTFFGFSSPLDRDRHEAQSSELRARRNRQVRRGGRARLRPLIDALEARALLSNIETVTNTSDSGPGSLRNAISSATPGEIINFARSAYGTITLSSGSLEIGTNLTIDGPGAKNVTINGNSTFQDLLVDANVTATVSGLTITGGAAPTTYPYGGGGILNDGSLTVANCVITGNSGGEVGGGILNNDSVTVINSVVSRNTASFGAGINNGPTASLKISGSTISNNVAGDLNGGIGNFGGSVKITNSVVSDNSAASGGGGIGDTKFSFGSGGGGGGTLTINNSIVSGNSAPHGENGGGILVSGGALTISGSTVANNTTGSSTASFGAGGGIAAIGATTVTISGTLFANNAALSPGNEGLVLGGAIFTTNIQGTELGFPLASLSISNSTFLGNSAVGGFQAYGGAIHVDPGVNVAVTGTSFTGNVATGGLQSRGGAVDLEQQVPPGQNPTQATITCSTFQGNVANILANSVDPGGSGQGGALFASGPLTVSGSTFTANRAIGGPGGGFGLGGAIDDQGASTFNLTNSLLTNNKAIGGPGGSTEGFAGGGWAFGGGLVANFGTIVTIANTGFVGNQATGGAASGAGNQGGLGYGGGISNSGESLSLTGCTLLSNQAIAGAGINGATGGNAEGGGIQNSGNLTVTSSAIIANAAIGGAGGGNAYGGGVFTEFGPTTFTDTLITLNQADGGSGGGQGSGGGLYIASGTTTLSGKTKVIGNFASTSDNDIFGP
jgi:hypothetical protein